MPSQIVFFAIYTLLCGLLLKHVPPVLGLELLPPWMRLIGAVLGAASLIYLVESWASFINLERSRSTHQEKTDSSTNVIAWPLAAPENSKNRGDL